MGLSEESGFFCEFDACEYWFFMRRLSLYVESGSFC